MAHSEVTGDLVIGVDTFGGLDKRHHVAGFLPDADNLPRLDLVRRDVDLLTVNRDVTVVDELTGGVDRRGQARTQNHRGKTQLELGEHLLTGTGGAPLGIVVNTCQLLLGQVVVPEYFLLLGLTNGVVAAVTTYTATVLTGRVGALLEVADRLTGQRSARAPGQPHLRSGVAHAMSFQGSSGESQVRPA